MVLFVFQAGKASFCAAGVKGIFKATEMLTNSSSSAKTAPKRACACLTQELPSPSPCPPGSPRLPFPTPRWRGGQEVLMVNQGKIQEGMSQRILNLGPVTWLLSTIFPSPAFTSPRWSNTRAQYCTGSFGSKKHFFSGFTEG